MPTSHHCPICPNGIFKTSCANKGHMWYCRTHECWVRRDWNCVKCENVARAAKRREEAGEAEEAKKRAEAKAEEEEINNGTRRAKGSTVKRKVKGSVPKALGSYTSCEGPPARGQTSPVAKIRKHIASTFAPKPPTHTTDFLKPEPDLVTLEWVSEENPLCARARSAPPTRQDSSDMRAAPSSLDPVNASDTMNVKNPTAEDIPKQPKPSRKLRHFSSRATIAGAGRAVFGSQVSEASIAIRPSTPTQTRPTTAGGDGGSYSTGDGQPGTKGLCMLL
ncbi:hypothetical protein GJ744_007248 [Endocarpon pusillum]|uniref:Uncharacterized protein n=1 Tax=Endocarpon pusillum TaxID=364733 RepID=A0A8H7E491_9EURO|nr:hypothetical protein GJ744_007248 [Endocarpon pusillum]